MKYLIEGYFVSGNSSIFRWNNTKWEGQSIRCVANETQAINHLVPENFSTIQEAIDYSLDGDTIRVSAGTYYENINFNGKNISVIGEDRETTIIDGGQNGSVITFNNGEFEDALLSEFTITNGSGTLGLQFSGGTENYNYGGGIFIYNSSPCLERLIIKENLMGGQYSIGGGIFMFNNSNPILSEIIVKDHEVDPYGAGIYIDTSSPILNNILLVNNFISSFSNRGGGIMIRNNSNPIIEYTTIVNNSGGIYSSEFSTPTLKNCILYGNETEINIELSDLVVSYSNVENGENGIHIINSHNPWSYDWLEGNINVNPQFADPENGDFSLQPISPCIDAGDPNSPLDPDGTIADMGVYYYNQAPLLGDLNNDFLLNVQDIIVLINIIIEIFENDYLPTDEELELGDIYTDGQLNVIDIVALVNIILEQ